MSEEGVETDEITPRAAAEQGRVHAGFWMRALWLAETLGRAPANRPVPRAASRRPAYADAKLLTYLAYVVSPPSEEAEAFFWRISEGIQVGPAICWLAAELRGARILSVDVVIDGVGARIRQKFDGPRGLAAHLRTIAEAFARRRDASFTDAEIRADMVRNLRARSASVLLTHEALAHPERHPDLLRPPTD